ncbi:MAG: ATP-binding protein [SAR324 cluster bacterium]|nr:ATP-binding protein [SAR324 cluster bacterium]
MERQMDEKGFLSPLELREQAKKRLAQKHNEFDGVSEQKLQEVLLELRIHQIELEMQNENLQEAEQQASLAGERYKNLFEFAPIGYFCCDESGSLLTYNHRLVEILGLSFSDRGRPFMNWAADEAQGDAFYRHIRKVNSTKSKQTVSVTLKNPEGDLIEALIESLYEHQGADSSMEIRSTLFDQTQHNRLLRESAQAREEAEAANLAKSDFLSLMSHELRTPMNGVLGVAQILKMEGLTQAQNDWCDIIIKSGNALVRILTDILDFSKGDAGKETLILRPFSLREVVEINASLFLGAALTKKIQLTWKADPKIQQNLIGDPDLLSRVISNLLGNAVKFTEHGNIDIFIDLVDESEEQQRIRFTIQDTGIGVDKDDLQSIFAPFTQSEDLSTRKHEGTGLGLSIVKSLVTLMNGKIWVQSKKDFGSTFFIEIPFGTPKVS